MLRPSHRTVALELVSRTAPTAPGAVATLKRRRARAQSWRDLAACLDHDTELFFPLNERAPETAADRTAKEVCRECPVRPECLGWALEHRPAYGIFGGFSARERQKLTRSGSGFRRLR